MKERNERILCVTEIIMGIVLLICVGFKIVPGFETIFETMLTYFIAGAGLPMGILLILVGIGGLTEE